VEGIRLWWIGERASDGVVIEDARTQVEHAFGVPVRLVRDPDRPTGTLDPARGQHLSSRVLAWLATVRPEPAGKLLAVTDVDLFIPILTFVFGEAKLEGDVAVVSTARLRTNPDGAAADRRLLSSRLGKECVHELGHTFGLLHCPDPQCVMARSASIVHVDVKRGVLCRECRSRFRDLKIQGGERHG
jgi:archaemetzincin